MLWLFLPFVVILSGVVAYAADTIAKKVGRKHIRWFGMRPKTTALLVAVLSGMGISAASLAAFLGLNRNAVHTIAQADQLRPQIDALRAEVKTVQKDLTAVQDERDRARQDALKLAGERSEAMTALNTAQTSLASAQADLGKARQTQQTLEQQQQALQEKIRNLTALQTTLEKKAQAAQDQMKTAEAALRDSRDRAQALKDQLLTLQTRSAQAILEGQRAQKRSEEAQAKAEQVSREAQATVKQAQVQAAQAKANAERAQNQAQVAREAAQKQIKALNTQLSTLRQASQNAQAARDKAVAARDAAEEARDAAVTARQQAVAQQAAAQQERDRLVGQRDQLVKQRDQAMKDRDQVQASLVNLKKQQLQLQSRNAEIARQLDVARASLAQLKDDFNIARAELNVTRNAELAYQKNDLVYAALVPSVRNLNTFLDFADQAARAHGARGNDQGGAVRLNTTSRTSLETKLRGLNTSSFVLCRATQNSAVGFPVDLTCDARANNVLFRAGQAIRSAPVTIDGKTTQAQITEIVQDAVLELTARGVPSDYINNQGLDVAQFADLLSKLSNRSGKVVVSVAARDDVKPASRVDLYAQVQ